VDAWNLIWQLTVISYPSLIAAKKNNFMWLVILLHPSIKWVYPKMIPVICAHPSLNHRPLDGWLCSWSITQWSLKALLPMSYVSFNITRKKKT
jgi:hypothetical protein